MPFQKAARLNFARLMRQVDVCEALPRPPIGIISQTYPMDPLPMNTIVIQGMLSLPPQRSSLETCLDGTRTEYIMYTSMYRVNDTISLPTFTVVLRDVTSPSVSSVIRAVRTLFDPYSFATRVVRFVQGEFKPIGNIWYFPKVRINASISPTESEPRHPRGDRVATLWISILFML